MQSKWWPTRKWWANAISVTSGWLIALITNEWVLNTELQVMAVGIVAGLLSSYVIPRGDSP